MLNYSSASMLRNLLSIKTVLSIGWVNKQEKIIWHSNTRTVFIVASIQTNRCSSNDQSPVSNQLQSSNSCINKTTSAISHCFMLFLSHFNRHRLQAISIMKIKRLNCCTALCYHKRWDTEEEEEEEEEEEKSKK